MVEYDITIQRFRDKETGALVSGKAFKNITHAAASISKDAKRSLKTGQTASRPGKPPRTRRGLFRRAVRFEADRARNTALIGFIASRVGESAKAHEFGGRYKGADYPERPTMRPALERNLHRMGGQFQGIIGG